MKPDCKEIMKRLVLIPTYNEIENIESIIKTTLSLPDSFDILIIDDNSPDGTADKVKELQKEYKSLYILERSGKLGLGTAYIAGFRWAIENGSYSQIFEMDADFSHNPNDLIHLSNSLSNGASLTVGSRYVTGINVVNWPLSRVLMSYFASSFVRFVTGMSIMDTTAGFVGYDITFLKEIDLDKIKMTGYGFQIEMKFTAWHLRYKVREVSIIFTDRTKGKSKMSGGIFNEAFWGVIGMKLRAIRGKIKAKSQTKILETLA